MTLSSTTTNDHLTNEELVLSDSVRRYFETANAGEFEQTAALFVEEGQLVPPFESPIVGRDAIAQYLIAEAAGMRFVPLRSETLDPSESSFNSAASSEQCPEHNLENGLEKGLDHCLVRGKVKTSLFTVNVAWEFMINHSQEILAVKVKLLAKLNELLKLKS